MFLLVASLDINENSQILSCTLISSSIRREEKKPPKYAVHRWRLRAEAEAGTAADHVSVRH